MIIDSHVHLIGEDWVRPGFAEGFVQLAGLAVGGSESTEALRFRYDASGETLVADMKKAGVDKSCIFALDFGLATGEAEVSIEDQNRKVAEAAARFPDQLIPFFTVDPRRPEGLSMMGRAIEDWGMRGLKLHPASGYYPGDPVVRPYYEKCQEYGIPVLVHSGDAMGIADSPLTRPREFDQVAADYPDLRFILAHLAYPYWREGLALAKARSNLHFDVSGAQLIVARSPGEFYRMLRAALDEIGPGRVFFGSDNPYYEPLFPLDRWVRAVKEPDLEICDGLVFSEEERIAVMGQAFAELLEISWP